MDVAVESKSSPGECSQTRQCQTHAVVDEVEIEVYGSVAASCSTTSAGVWSCRCQTDRSDGAFQLSTTDEPTDVCDAAAIRCESLIEAELSGAGG